MGRVKPNFDRKTWKLRALEGNDKSEREYNNVSFFIFWKINQENEEEEALFVSLRKQTLLSLSLSLSSSRRIHSRRAAGTSATSSAPSPSQVLLTPQRLVALYNFPSSNRIIPKVSFFTPWIPGRLPSIPRHHPSFVISFRILSLIATCFYSPERSFDCIFRTSQSLRNFIGFVIFFLSFLRWWRIRFWLRELDFFFFLVFMVLMFSLSVSMKFSVTEGCFGISLMQFINLQWQERQLVIHTQVAGPGFV